MKFWVFVFLLVSSVGQAHPVSYKDAVSLVSYNTSEMNEILLTYSFTSNLAVAGTYLRDTTSEFYIPRLNWLVKRWNNEDSQGNIYFSAGSGIEKFEMKNYAADLFEFSADWESRKYYIDFDHLYISRSHNKNILIPDQHYNFTKVRAGLAPFLADYSDLNVWLILQAEKYSYKSNIEMTQFLRFYIKNTLWEIGARFDGGGAFNYMIHF